MNHAKPARRILLLVGALFIGAVVMVTAPSASTTEAQAIGATFTVNTIEDRSDACGDEELCSLREAMAAVNGEPAGTGPHLIAFDIPGSGPHTILPESPLPILVNPVVIDGYSQPGASPNTLHAGNDADLQIVVSGAGFDTIVDGLIELRGGDSVVRGLVINNAVHAGIAIRTGGGNTIEGNFIGIDANGENAAGNAFDGIGILSSADNLIGGPDPGARNVISGNAGNGVSVLNAASIENAIQNNYIGVDSSGESAIGNEAFGVRFSAEPGHVLYASRNLLGGVEPEHRNLISGNGGGAHVVRGEENVIQGNFIGTDVTGTSAIPNAMPDDPALGAGVGVLLDEASSNQVGGTEEGAGNLISGNDRAGVMVIGGVWEANDNLIEGNIIGLSENGVDPLGNGRAGVSLFSLTGIERVSGNTVGGGHIAARNVISGNHGPGVELQGANAAENAIQGNFIGVTQNGDSVVGNQEHGIVFDGASENLIGGSDADLANTIAGNALDGVHLTGGATLNELRGNRIGVTIDGVATGPNERHGVSIVDSPHNLVGGDSPDDRNIISGNSEYGVFISGDETTGLDIIGNYIGLGSDGQTPAGNREHGVYVSNAGGNFIGGIGPGEGNVIAFNGEDLEQRGHGVVIESGVGNSVRFNSIYDNHGRGIDLVAGEQHALGEYPFTLNDWLDRDTGANNLQNYPHVSKVEFGAAEKTIEWTLHSEPNTEFRLDFYSNDQPDPSGFGQGQTYLETQVGMTAGHSDHEHTLGEFTVSITVPANVNYIAATATDPDNNTSEFSMVDTAGDAIADAWITNGIDVNEDGNIDLNLSERGATIDRKNIFVEVNAMQGFAPSEETLEMLHFGRDGFNEGFGNVPAELANNPDGSRGINLILEIGDLDIPAEPWTDSVEETNWPAAFDGLKLGSPELDYVDGRFGRPADRLDANWTNIRLARLLVYRFALYAQTYDDGLGMAWVRGNDLFITLGEWPTLEELGLDRDPTEYDRYRENPLAQTGVFMHELGHSLGLQHGGHQRGKEYNHKPNYRSIMNYTWSRLPDEDYPEGWRLDYSRVALDDIHESCIDVDQGFGGDQHVWVPIGPNYLGDEYQIHRLVPEGGVLVNTEGQDGLDVDCSGVDGADPASAIARDVNFLRGKEGHPGQILQGREDWTNLEYAFHHAPSVSGQVDNDDLPDEHMTVELDEELRANAPGPGMLEFNRGIYDHDDSSATASVRIVRVSGIEGEVSVHVATSDGTAVAGVDYDPVDETITFQHGEYAKSVGIAILSGSKPGVERTINLTLSEPAGGAVLGSPATAVLRVISVDDAFVVTNTNDSGAGSLRRAIEDANASEGHDRIIFDIPGDGVHSIEFLTRTPVITQPVTIDGFSQPGASPNTLELGNDAVVLIELDGGAIEFVSGAQNAGLAVQAGDSTIRGLSIDAFPGSGIHLLDGDNNIVQGNFMGVDASGESGAGNRGAGLRIEDSSSNLIGGTSPAARNLISNAQTAAGISLPGVSAENVIQGNYIGTDRHGLAALGNNTGIVSRGFGGENLFGGSEPGAGNLISGNAQSGIDFPAAFSTNNIFQGNFIGTDRTGVAPLGNGWSGIALLPGEQQIGGTEPGAGNVIAANGSGGIGITSNNVIQGNFIGVGADGETPLGNDGGGIAFGTDNIFGGVEDGAGNVVSSNSSGVFVGGDNNLVQGNFIGTDATGMIPMGNNGNGIGITGDDNLIGGTEDGAGNVISANGDFGSSGGNGVSIVGQFTVGNVIQGNLIGTAADGVTPLGNHLSGISITSSTNHTTVGGKEPGAGNVIAHNRIWGVLVESTTFQHSVGNSILSNSIHSNGGLGINLAPPYTVTENVGGDENTGSNDLQNFPVITNVSELDDGSGSLIEGTLNSRPEESFRVELFANNSTHLSGHGQGETLVGSIEATTDGSGNADFSVEIPIVLTVGQFVTATATSQENNTSEFSEALPVAIEGYALTVLEPDGEGTVSPDVGVHDFEAGAEVVLQGEPAPGWRVSHWEVGNQFMLDGSTITMDSHLVARAVFEEIMYTLRIWFPEGEGTVEPGEGSHQYPAGAEVTVQAFPADGWSFSHWALGGPGGDVGPDTPTLTVTMDDRIDLQPVFTDAETMHQLTVVEPEGAGRVTPEPGTYEFAEDMTVELHASPDDGWVFSHWILDEEPGPDSASISITLDSDRTAQAVFSRQMFTLTILDPDGDGQVDPGPGEHAHPAGSEVELHASPDDGWEFSHWIFDREPGPDTASISITLDSDRTVQAVFSQQMFTLTMLHPEGGGQVEPAPGDHEHPAGSEVELHAIPDDGWEFSHWILDGEPESESDSASASISITLDSDRTVQAVFAEEIEACTDLIAGQHTVAGEVCISHDDEEVRVVYKVSDGWTLVETHLAASYDEPGSGEWTDRRNRWQNPEGNPAPGRFPHHGDLGQDGDDEYSVSISLESLGEDAESGDVLFIAAHAVVEGEGRESAWADGERFIEPGPWAMYFEYELQ